MTLARRTEPLALQALPAPHPFTARIVRELTLLVAAVALLSLLAQVSFTAPFSSNRAGDLVPITGQTLGVLLIGMSFGARRGTAAVAVYLLAGFAGAPVFTNGTSGMILFTGATAGYLWGFLLAAAFLGFCADRGLDRGPWLYAVLLGGNALVYATGLPVLALWLERHSLPVSALDAGLWPFIAGDLAKLMAAALLLPVAWAVVGARWGQRASPGSFEKST